MVSFSLLRTNPGLTTNIKVIVDSNYNLFLDSINTNPQLSIDKFKKYQFTKDNLYDELIPNFFDDLPVDTAFDIKYDGDVSIMGSDFSKQYDDIYQMGARNILDNKDYEEEFEFFAPLYIFKQSLPQGFFIFRVDGPGLLTLTKDNFRSEIVSNLKCVKYFDMTLKTSLGEWIDKNFTSNLDFPRTGFELDFRALQFSIWNGINYDNGGYTSKSFFLDETLEIENSLHDFEKFVFDGFKQNHLIFPHIINFSFLFDDVPATSTSLRTWSMNRYYGFYIDDLDFIEYVTPFSSKPLYNDIVIGDGNVIYSASYSVPFQNGYNPNIDYWVELDGQMYQVVTFKEDTPKQFNMSQSSLNVFIEEFEETVETKFRIISDIDFSGRQADLNQKICYVNSSNYLVKYVDGSYFIIDNFSLADVWVIKIDGVFHRLIQDQTGIKVLTDYSFNFVADVKFEYYINSPNPNYKKTLNIFIEKNADPFSFEIFRLNFSDVKDFDTKIVNNKFASFEYERSNELTITDEPKLFTTDLRSKSDPKPLNDYQFNDKIVNIPVSSDYTSNLETFRIENNDLVSLWRKNSVSLRWGYQNSLSLADYPYLMNNSLVHGDYNRTANTHDFNPNRPERNLDYFYSINSGTTSYSYQSLNVDKNVGYNQDSTYFFNRGYYLNIGTYSLDGSQSFTYSYDYFKDFFGGTESFLGGQVVNNVHKWSLFESGDNSIPNMTVFRGVKFKIFDVDNVKVSNGFIDSVNLTNNNAYQDYKFSIILSKDKNIPIFCSFSIMNNSKSYWSYQGHPSYLNRLALNRVSVSKCAMGVGSLIELNIPEYTGYARIEFINGSDIIVSTIGGSPIYYYGPTMSLSSTASNNYVPALPYNEIDWNIIDNFQHDKHYQLSSLVLYHDIIYESNKENEITDPNIFPFNSPYWNLWKVPTSNIVYSVFWSPNYSYSTRTSINPGEIVYRQGEWWERSSSTGVDFWNPGYTYSINDLVLSNGQVWQAVLSNINQEPSVSRYQLVPYTASNIGMTTSFGYWIATQSNTKWEVISMWNPSLSYIAPNLVMHDNIIWMATASTSVGDEPFRGSLLWNRKYSFVPDDYTACTPRNNSILLINNKYYYIMQNGGIFTLDGGITNFPGLLLDDGIIIYVNHKYQNVLIDILINDKTTLNISNVPRDVLYNELNSRLTAANLMQSINNLHIKYGFAKYVQYVVIDKSGSYATYSMSNGITDLPSMVICEDPDHLQMQNNSLKALPKTISENKLTPKKILKNGIIPTIFEINFYNGNPLGYKFERVQDQIKLTQNYHGQRNIVYDNIYRHSGYYMPLIYNIELFQSYFVDIMPYVPGFSFGVGKVVPPVPGTFSQNLDGNYIFDSNNLNKFGIIGERIISKVNRKGPQLKLNNDLSNKPIYPMLDEFGYATVDFFIFKSTWDFEYLFECSQNNNK